MLRPPRVVLLSLGVLSFFIVLVFAAGRFIPGFSMPRMFGSPPRGTVLLRDLAAIDRNLTAPLNLFTADSVLKALGRLEQENLGVAARLSILKRYRALAYRDGDSGLAYRDAALRASELFPHSQELAAVALDSLFGKDWGIRQSLGPEESGMILGLASRLEDSAYIPLKLYVRLRTGAFADAESALAVPDAESLLASAASVSPPGAAPQRPVSPQPVSPQPAQTQSGAFAAALRRDRLLLLLLGGDRMGALAGIDDELEAKGRNSSPDAALAADVHYDFGDPREAAALYGHFTDDFSLLRRADALVLAGELTGARALWTTLVRSSGTNDPGLRGEEFRGMALGGELGGEELRVKALYNLARTSQDNDGIRRLTDALLALDPNHEAGTILHSRTMGDAQANVFLSRAGSAAAGSLGSGSAASGSAGSPRSDSADGALLSLESVRRASPNQEALRTVAQIWLRIEKYPKDGRLYRWGAYYFQTMAFFEELQQLLSMAALHGLSGDQAFWIDLHQGLEAMRLGQLNQAERLLAASYEGWADWRVPANLGRIKESMLSMAKALELYGTAISLGRTDRRPTGLSLAQEGTRASAEELSILHQRMARCYAALGRAADARRALESALEINPDNREARMELRKM